ncbi:sulfite exporter TauE/SafE family protein [Acinetobacter larvae]|uniref:Probable membrane transporter protein n=1 Tax=Acinetobacter larvae TaxID=1789224 RepID=A0A1B2LVK3_9GAMM|nr:sulfite exporter TauE/SafE family protein [Acinetobacter larvae]AOA56934.1 hypothetical protein BFG52_00205 [Acinetobacter larvae]
MLGVVIAVFTVAGMIKGMLGLGLPAVSMGLLSLWMSPFHAASLLVLPSMLTNFWQLFAEGGVLRLCKRFWSLILGIIVGAYWSIFPTLNHHDFPSEALLGSMLALYGLYGLYARQLPNFSKHEAYLSPIVGYLGGALTVATGVVVIPVVPYLQSLQLKRDDLVQSLGLAFTVSTLCLALFLYHNPVDDFSVLNYLSWAALLPAVLGMWLGTRLRHRIAEAKFRRLFFYGLCALGLYMLSGVFLK